MTPLVLLGGLVLLPVIVAFFLRVNAAVLFMSLCVGDVLVQFVAGNSSTLLNLFGSHTQTISQATVRLALLLIPAALTLVFMLHSIHGGVKAIWNLVPALGAGLLLALLVEPVLPGGMQHTLEQSSYWHKLVQSESVVVSGGAMVSLLFLWFQRRGGQGHGSKHGHSKSSL